MTRPWFLVSALASTALFFVAAGTAGADTGAATAGADTGAATAGADTGATTAAPEPTAVIGSPATEPVPALATAGPAPGEIQTGGSAASAGSAPPAPQPQVPPVQLPQRPAVTPTAASPTAPSVSAPSPAQTTTPTVPANQTSQPASAAAPVEQARPTSVPTSEAPAATRETAPALASVPVAAPDIGVGAVPAPRTEGRHGVILERLLPDVERRLRGVQEQIGDLQRQLAVGVPPPPKSLMRLRMELESIAPALSALEARVDASGHLSPELRQLIDRVHTRLDGTRASAATLAAALRDSGLRGPEVQLLLSELGDFQALGSGLLPDVHRAPAPALHASMGDVVHASVQTAPAAASVQQAAPPPARPASGHPATVSQGSGPPDGLAAPVSAPGSASASPSGAFAVAGLAALAAFLCALALPQLLSRLQLPPMRCYAATFLVPLERPG
jgi:hypothetical protein